jgi:hypothetical protein
MFKRKKVDEFALWYGKHSVTHTRASKVLASSADREIVISRLLQAQHDGYFISGEYDTRLEAALRAVNTSDLFVLLRGLPEPMLPVVSNTNKIAKVSSRRFLKMTIIPTAICILVVVLLSSFPSKSVTSPPVTAITRDDCLAIHANEPQAKIESKYGISHDAGAGGSFQVNVNYDYDEDYYGFGKYECDVYYGPQHNVSMVYLETVPEP